jgi:hypothetical protein
MVLETVRQEAGPLGSLINALKTKQALRGPSGSTPLRSDGCPDGQAGGRTSREMVKDALWRVGNNSRKLKDLVIKLA